MQSSVLIDEGCLIVTYVLLNARPHEKTLDQNGHTPGSYFRHPAMRTTAQTLLLS
jgi:hypothetical protein